MAQTAQVTSLDNSRQKAESKSLIVRMADKFGVDDKKFLKTLKDTVFKQDKKEITNEQLMMVLIVADQHNLNPFTKEIYAFPSKAGIVPVVGYDGWVKLVNSNPMFDGVEFIASPKMVQIDGDAKECPEYITCKIYRKDREHPIQITEYLDEVYQPKRSGKNRNTGREYSVSGPWQTHTKRQLRTKAFNQAARVAFGLSGFYDPDEAERFDGVIAHQDISSSEGSVIDSESTVVTDDVTAPIMINHQRIDPVITGLIKRAESTTGGWQAAKEYVNGSPKFSNDERLYIVDQLVSAEANPANRQSVAVLESSEVVTSEPVNQA